MGRYELEYPKDAVNLVKRHGERGIYALEKIHSLVNSTQMLHVSFNPHDSPFPVILPMIGQMGSFERPSADIGDPLDLYLHGYVSARLFNTARKPVEGSSSSSSPAVGMPVCVAASHIDGLVLALSPFNHSYNYRSAVLFGHATLVESDEERLYAMRLITDGVLPGRWENSRQPPTGGEMQSTSILRVKIASGSAKIRDGGVSEDKHDLENREATGSIWTGVVPVYSSMGEPIPGPNNKVDLPAYASDFFQEFNQENRDYSIAAAKK